jgi:hypothetical protein
MKGFEIYINDEKLCASTDMGVVLITINKVHNDIYITTTGIDKAVALSIDWGRRKLCIGDRIKITAADIEVNSPPVSIKSLDRQELLAEYHILKEMLIKEKLLK